MNREQFLGLGRKVQVHPVQLPFSDEPVHFRELTGSERTKFFLWLSPNGKHDSKRAAQSNAKLVSLVLCDENGMPILTEADFEQFAGWPAWQQDPIVEAANVFAAVSSSESPDEYVARLKKKSTNSPNATEDTHN